MLTVSNYTLILFTIIYSVYILWQTFSWLVKPTTTISKKEPKTKVSVIIPCRNEEKNIGNCLNSILRQNYPLSLIEIIIVDDHSTDKTQEVAEGILGHSTFAWKNIQLPDNLSNKKNAINLAITASAGDLIIITDGDCEVGEDWVSCYVSQYESNNYQMICGPVALVNGKSMCEKFQSLEVAGLSLLAGAGIFSKAPLLCNGANIAYTKRAFEAIGRFEGIDSVATGDDTLLLFKMNSHFPGQVGYLKNREAIVYTQAQHSWRLFLEQRTRWASKGFISKNKLNSLVSTIVFVTNFLLFIYTIGSLVYFSLNWVFITCLFIKFTIDFLLLTCAIEFFKRRKLLLLFFTSEFITMAYISWIGLAANFSGYNWKGRDY